MIIARPNKESCERNVRSFGYEACGKPAVARIECESFNGNVCATCLHGYKQIHHREGHRVKDVRK